MHRTTGRCTGPLGDAQDHWEVVEAQGGQEDQAAWVHLEDHKGDRKYPSSQWHKQGTSKPWDSYPKYSQETTCRWITLSRRLKAICALTRT
jgi:hypothetical protein